jgi:hypothetical protein
MQLSQDESVSCMPPPELLSAMLDDVFLYGGVRGGIACAGSKLLMYNRYQLFPHQICTSAKD